MITRLFGSYYWLPKGPMLGGFEGHNGFHFIVVEEGGREVMYSASTLLSTRWGWLCRVYGGLPLDTTSDTVQ